MWPCGAAHLAPTAARCADCKEIDIVGPFTDSQPGDTFCVPSSAFATDIPDADVQLIKECLSNPSPACFVRLQVILAETGCVDCLPFIQNLEDIVNTYCDEHTTREACNNVTTTTCHSADILLGARCVQIPLMRCVLGF